MSSSGVGDGAVDSRAANSLKSALAIHGASTRSDLARLTGLPKSTVAGLIQRLAESGEVEIAPAGDTVERGTRGRRPTVVKLATRAGAVGYLGLSPAGLTAKLMTRTGDLLAEAVTPANPLNPEFSFVETGERALRAAMGQPATGADTPVLAAIVVGIPGPFQRGVGIAGARDAGPLDPGLPFPRLPDWMLTDPTIALGATFGVPAVGENNANLAALGEATHGASRGAGSALYLRLVNGVGAGIVINGDLFRGASGLAGEIVHIHVLDDGPPCLCGRRGCLAAVLQASPLDPDSAGMTGAPNDGDTGKLNEVFTRAAFGQLARSNVLTETTRMIGRIVSDLCLWLSPEVIVTDGRLGAVAGHVVDVLTETLVAEAGPVFAQATRIVPGVLGDDAETKGALALAERELLNTKTGLPSPTYV